jgi:hypothetical protein
MSIFRSIFGGGSAGGSEMRQSNNLMRQNIARLEALQIPSIEDQRIFLENPELIDLLEAQQLGDSRMEEVQFDPRLQAAQRASLEQLAGILEGGGMDAQSRLNLEEGLRRAASTGAATMATGIDRLQAEGLGDSGARYALMNSAAQNAANQAQQAGLQTAAQADAARRAAMMDQASLASQMSQQDIGLKTGKASAADSIAQFNAQQRAGTNAANFNYRANRANQVAANANQGQIYNSGLIPQQFQNQVQRAGLINQATGNLAGNLQAQAAAAQQAQQAQTGALLNMGGTLGAAAIQYSDKNLKKNIKEYDANEFLDKLNGYEYDYKDEKYGKGKQVGVMAQDLEKSKLGKELVQDTEEGKVVDYGKSMPTIVASLAELHKRLKKLEK